jgi:serine/threonine protein kinase
VKQIIDRPDKRERLVQMFEKEVSILRMMDHSRVVKFLGACMDPPCIVTEFVECGSLRDRLSKVSISNNWPVVLKIATGIAEGMKYVHSLGVCHKDINPNNILVDSNWEVYITDFGIASLLSACGGEVTTTGQIGTARYAAPELLLSKQVRVQPFKADVYSFGLVVYALCNNGTEPYHGETEKEVFASMLRNSGRRPPFKKRNIPKPFITLVTKCWNGKPSLCPSFVEIVEMLKDITF